VIQVQIKNILFLEPQPCIRALKYASGLRWMLGEKIKIVFGYVHSTLNDLYGYGNELFNKFEKLNLSNLKNDIRRLVKEHNIHIIHSHNAPDYLTVAAIEAVKGDIPIVHDTHDPLSMRKTKYYSNDSETKLQIYRVHEKIANEECDGRIYVAEGIREYFHSIYRLDPNNELVFHNYALLSATPKRLKEKLSRRDGQVHVVYIGTLTSRVPGSHYDLRKIFKGIAEHGIHVHLYPSRLSLNDKAYKDMASNSRYIHYHGNLDHKTLLYEITKYDFGWAGFNINEKNEKHMEIALPNKFFEYVACGLPVLTFQQHKSIRNLVEKYNIGIVLNSLDDIPKIVKNRGKIKTLQDNLMKLRYNFTVEKNIHRLVNFYQNICHQYSLVD